MDDDAVLPGNRRNGLDSRPISAAPSLLVQGGEHVIEAGAWHRKHEEARRIGADIAIGKPWPDMSMGCSTWSRAVRSKPSTIAHTRCSFSTA